MLSAEYKQIINQGEIEGSYFAEEWIALLKDLLTQYQNHIAWQNKISRKNSRLFWLTFFCTALILFWLISWWSIFIAFGLAYIILRYRKKKFAVFRILPNPTFVEITQNYFLPLFRFLSLETQQKIEAKLNFKPLSECRLSNRLYQVANYDVVENTHIRPMLALQTIFNDKTRISVEISEKIVVKNKKNRYRTRKSKSKTKRLMIYDLKAIFHPKNYAPLDNTGNLKLELKDKQINPKYDLQHLLEMIAMLYSSVRPV
jgi:hypothetical protein